MRLPDVRECPCCGKPGKLKDAQKTTRRGSFRQGWVGCPACGLYIQWTHDPAGAIRKWNRRAASVQPNVRLIDGNALYRTAVSRAEKKGIYFNEMDRVISPKDIEDAPTIILSAPSGDPSSGASRHLPPGEGGDDE